MSTISSQLPKPVNVSPAIKFFRWTFLISGIFYGVYHHRRFSRIEHIRREIEERERPEREARLREERLRESQRALDELMSHLK